MSWPHAGVLALAMSCCLIFLALLPALLALRGRGRGDRDKQPKHVQERCANARCNSLRDPRCQGLNCTEHCASTFGCNGVCIRQAAVDKEQADLRRYLGTHGKLEEVDEEG